MPLPSASRRRLVAIGVLVVLSAGSSAAEGEAAPVEADEPAPPVAYDALFRLPSDTGSRPGERVGPDRKRWEDRFAAVRVDLSEAQAELARSQTELEAIARKTESWQMAAPGAQPTAENSPVSYKLRQDIRRQREAVGRAERRLRELEVEASLAGVPPEWRGPQHHEDAAPGS
jgi:hypothetical protein